MNWSKENIECRNATQNGKRKMEHERQRHNKRKGNSNARGHTEKKSAYETRRMKKTRTERM